MAKKKNNNTLLIVAVIIVALVLFFKSSLNNQETLSSNNTTQSSNENENQENQNWILFTVSPPDLCLGENVTGDITSDMPGQECIFQYRLSSLLPWQTLNSLSLDSNGAYTVRATANQVGSVTFRVVCGALVSNQQTVTVTNCSSSAYECTDSDGGIDFLVSGNCQDSYHQTGFSDGCVDGVMREYYCDNDGICQWVPNEDYNCNGMACEAIVIPTGQGTCSPGFCLTGTCTFIPGDLANPASCGCQ
jgi:hypothetical protein